MNTTLMTNAMANDSISLKEQIIKSSYHSILIDYSPVLKLSAHKENYTLDIERDLIEYPFTMKHELRILLGECNEDYAGAGYAGYFDRFKLFIESIKNGYISFLKIKELKEAKSAYNSFIKRSNEKFKSYKKEHEKLIVYIAKDAQNINRQKTLMKGYLLNKLFHRLKEIGIETSLYDWPDEYIDLRNYPLNEKYNLIEQRHLRSQKIAQSLSNIFDIEFELNYLYLIYKRLKNSHEIKKLQSELKELEICQKFIDEQISSDLTKLDVFHESLNNITKIYKDTTEVLGPILEKLLEELKWIYGQNLSEMPREKVEAIRRIKDLLKDLSEVLIIPQNKENDEVFASVFEFSNNLSRKHSKLKSEMLSVA